MSRVSHNSKPGLKVIHKLAEGDTLTINILEESVLKLVKKSLRVPPLHTVYEDEDL